MATRSLTDVFVLMRNNSTQSRNIYSEQRLSERVSLMNPDLEAGVHLLRNGSGDEDSNEPPSWVDSLEEAQYSLSKIQGKLRELESLHTKHLHRPTMDDSAEEESQIDALNKEIARMFNNTHKIIQQIRRNSVSEARHGKEKRLSYNVVSCLVTSMQELSNKFRESQGNYLRKLNSREERSKQYLMLPEEMDTQEQPSAEDVLFGLPPGTNAITSQQLLVLADNTAQAEQREEEVRKIVSSIIDLNSIFKDLAHMVVDQGTVLDRIDFNVERTQEQVTQGFRQLQKAERYQRSNRKMKCILIMTATVIVLLFLLIIIKS
ncbi:syntaxin-16 [Cloeon dipterum]|uniref:t-SNARE coiled-coil homology domain-containing protein n=1 Tax=Cloeon dipterum TaxID=197152 RepID=A0A8S1CAY1_9INSE|nr:Hypothetical predicted protein [Cloeon dipterum]